jgi:saccharopine dehydrogenase (NADP+, L-glutamate forming)
VDDFKCKFSSINPVYCKKQNKVSTPLMYLSKNEEMKNILLFGAGKSATFLIEYLGKCCNQYGWKMTVIDTNLELATFKTKLFPSAKALSINVSDEKHRGDLIQQADIVISMLPPTLHFLVAKDCVKYAKNLLTASYLDGEISSLKDDVEKKGILFLGEMGLDPGIDHMSAMQMIHKIKNEGGQITSFKSHCGGLVAPESDDNPWHYKITWNPANVVSAGSAGAVFLKDNKIVTIDYSDIFKDEGNVVDVPTLFPLAWYANRDSMSYIDTYQLKGTSTFIRTTLRYPSFCRGWNKVVALDFTNKNDFDFIKNCKTWNEWFQLKMNYFLANKTSIKERDFINEEFLTQINYLGINSESLIPIPPTNSANWLQFLLEEKLVMQPNDKDMIIMLHEIQYSVGNEQKEIRSCLIVKGDDQLHTAMAKTVGLPLGIAAKLILQNEITLIGMHIPVIPEIYNPVLEELAMNGIQFHEEIKNS